MAGRLPLPLAAMYASSMIPHAASFCVVRGSLIMREARYRMLPGCRSSDFFCRVHLLVAVSTASRMSLAMLRGRLVIGLLRIISEDDRAFAAIRVLDISGRQMQRADHRLAGIGSHLGQGVLQALPRGSEGAEWIVDPDAPIGACDEFAGHPGSIFRQSGLMQPESKLDDVGDTV